MSKIEVDAITEQSGSTLTTGGGAGKTVVVDATTVTLGRCGGTVALASGASQTGFGRTGTVNWQTTPKTGDFTAVNGEGYFVNTTSGGVTMTMPSGSAGAIVSIQDYNKTFDSNNLIIAPASGEKINGGTASASLIINTEGQGLTFVYVDGTVGWKSVYENEFTAGGSDFITATGGTITTVCTNFKVHTFTGPGTFCVSTAGSPTNGVVSYMVLAGGGGGGWDRAGGGGGGGFREFKSPVTPYTASPLNGNPGGTSVSITAPGAFPITVGGGGTGGNDTIGRGVTGSNSIFSTITSAGGGGGGAAPSGQGTGLNGGSGGGAAGPGSAGSGNTPPVSPAQGTNGGAVPGVVHAAGGGGATAVGTDGASPAAGAGGAGATTSINNSPTTYAGGGGGGHSSAGTSPPTSGAAGGSGGGGAGGNAGGGLGTAGTTNTGGGGGGGANNPNTSPAGNGGAGGSGIVIIRYKFQ